MYIVSRSNSIVLGYYYQHESGIGIMYVQVYIHLYTHEAADQANVQVALVTSLQSLNTNNAETVVRSISTPLKTNMDPEYDGLQ